MLTSYRHTDGLSQLEHPPAVGCFYCIEAPFGGSAAARGRGATRFIDTQRSFAQLPAADRELALRCRVRYTSGNDVVRLQAAQHNPAFPHTSHVCTAAPNRSGCTAPALLLNGAAGCDGRCQFGQTRAQATSDELGPQRRDPAAVRWPAHPNDVIKVPLARPPGMGTPAEFTSEIDPQDPVGATATASAAGVLLAAAAAAAIICAERWMRPAAW